MKLTTKLSIIPFLALATAPAVYAQGCIVARSSSIDMAPESQGGYLQTGDWELTIGYRHQFSYKHFVGDVEQKYRVQQGTQVMNKINLEDIDLTYQATPRFSFTINAPLLLASRRSNNSYYTTTSSGLGDMTLIAQGWLWNPRHARRGNIAIGYGVQAPTGKDNVQNNVLTSASATTPTTVTADYSIQPGSGGWGMVFQWQAFRELGRDATVYTTGNYLATQGGTNNVLRSATAVNQPLTAYNAIQDQYLLQAGVAFPIRKIRGLTVTFGPRMEGVPASNLIGNDLGFRRPGFAISAEPGFVYARGGSMLQASVGKAIYRDRTRSVPDKMLGTHGDAAFADYVWLVSYTYRMPKHRSESSN
ncbi:MAG TPA: hypothetical protein VN736_13520 [Candidatus Limnocylindrales bacterium]|nr:hypothetical protein [Candidatus Limnocylindrales bacterium]